MSQENQGYRVDADLAVRPDNSVVGETVPHESAALHVTGQALYTDDLVGRRPGVLHAWPVQTACAHGIVTKLDAAPAYRIPGVVRVLCADDVPGVADSGIKHDEPLFPAEVVYHGQAVSWVLGETLEAARTGAAAVVVEIEPLTPILTVADAIAAGSYQGGRRSVVRGDTESALAAADLVVEGEFEIGGQEHFYLETQAALAEVDENGQVFVQCSTQHPSETQDIVAHVLDLPSSAVTVQCLRMGGGFGGKEMQPHGYAAIAALGAVLTGRPVRLRLTRSLDFTMTGKRHPFHVTFRAGWSSEGRLEALEARLTSDGGFSLDLSEPVLARALCHFDNAYFIPHVRVEGAVARTNKTSQTAFRGFGGPQGMLVVEEVIGRSAPLLGIPAHELRRRNFYQPGQSTPYGQPVRHAERLDRIWSTLADRADLDSRRAAIVGWNAEHRHTRRAIAVTPVKFGISFNFTAFNQAGALVHVYKDGSVLINHGGTEMGQGLHTKMLQVAATALGVPMSHVRVAPTRTDKVPNTSATAASSGADLNGAAIRDACRQIVERLEPYAHLDWDKRVSAAYFDRVSLSANGFYRTEGLHWDPVALRGEPFKYFAYGAAAAEVEVDGFTGGYRLIRVDIVHDVGDSLSPGIDIGQIEGGFVQGLGWLTLEELRWDTDPGPHGATPTGRITTQTASTYKLPSFSELPDEFNVHLLDDATEDGAIYGSKAVGEPPLMLAIAVREALREAVAAFGDGRHSVEIGCPATPEAVWWALEKARADALE